MANIDFIPNVKTAVGFDNMNTISTYTNQVAASTLTVGDTYNIILPAPDEILFGQFMLLFIPDSTSIAGMKISINGGIALPIYAGSSAIGVGAIISGLPISVLVDIDGSKIYSLDALVSTKSPSANPTFTGTVSGITKTMVGLGNVDDTSDSTKNSATVTLTNKRITKRVGTIATGTPAPAGDSHDVYTVTALAAGVTVSAPTGTPTNGQTIIIRIKDNGTARTLAWNAIYRPIGVTLPSTTVISKTVYIGCMYNSSDSKWDVLAVGQEA